MTETAGESHPQGVISVLDTDLYKLTMQNAVQKFFPNVDVTYKYTNRTTHLHLNVPAFEWLKVQISKLANLRVSDEEIDFLREQCKYLTPDYLRFLRQFTFQPSKHVDISFAPKQPGSDQGQVAIVVKGKWIDTILYEIPLLALVSESYFKFCDTDWTHDGQEEKAYDKGVRLCSGGCQFSEFGSRRRRDYRTHELVMQGLVRASKEGPAKGWSGKLTGTSNVHFAKRFGIAPIGTVAHEWFMSIAAITNDYKHANELGLRYWVATFGKGALSIALTDTFGTPDFLKAFSKPAPDAFETTAADLARASTFAQIFAGTRQDSGDPTEFVKLIKEFYVSQGITSPKTVVFSDSLDVEKCIEYKKVTEDAGLVSSFGIGTFFTNDFVSLSSGQKSVPLNIVIKVSEAEGRPAVKISDNLGKNTGDSSEVARVKKELGYTEHDWSEGDETRRWDKHTQ